MSSCALFRDRAPQESRTLFHFHRIELGEFHAQGLQPVLVGLDTNVNVRGQATKAASGRPRPELPNT